MGTSTHRPYSPKIVQRNREVFSSDEPDFVELLSYSASKGKQAVFGAGWVPKETLKPVLRMERKAACFIEETYGMKPLDACAIDVLKKIFLICAEEDKCHIFRLQNDAPDAPVFKEKLLTCMLSGICSANADSRDSLQVRRQASSYMITMESVEVF